SVNYIKPSIDSTQTRDSEQHGIQARHGGYDITVGGHTQLSRAALASTADPSRNRLSTGSLSATDLENRAAYEAESFSISGGTSGGGGNPWSGGVSPGLGGSQDESISSTTPTGISAGTIEIRDGDESALANLDRSVTELQQDGLRDIFDLQRVQERMEMGQVAGEVGFQAAGDLAGRMGWEEGSPE